MGKATLRVIFICGAVALLLAVVLPSGSRNSASPVVQQVSAMRQIGLKLQGYDIGHSAIAPDDIRTKSVEDFVAMNILTSEDAAYLHEHQVRFYGYDRNHIAGDVPLLEITYRHDNKQTRITCYSDISVVTSRAERIK